MVSNSKFLMRNKLTLVSVLSLSALIVAGCVSSSATRTTTNPDGSQTSDTVKADAFLGNIHNGSYSNGTGMTLSVTDATPDQQSIATLAGGVVELGKAALLLAKPATNSPAVTTNAVTKP